MITDLRTYARKGLEAELARLDAERERVKALLASLSAGGSEIATRQPASVKRPRQMSEAGRQAIREAVKRRWERVKAAAAGGVEAADSTASGTPPAVAALKRARREPRSGNRKK